MRDPLVAVEPDSGQLLLGWTYLSLGGLRIGTPSYFTLERLRPLTEAAPPASSEPAPDSLKS